MGIWLQGTSFTDCVHAHVHFCAAVSVLRERTSIGCGEGMFMLTSVALVRGTGPNICNL